MYRTSGSTHPGKTAREFGGRAPVGGGAAAVEQPGRGHDEGAGADGGDPGGRGQGPQRLDQPVFDLGAGSVVAFGGRDHHGVRRRKYRQVVADVDGELGVGAQFAGTAGAGQHLVVGLALGGTGSTEQLVHYAQLHGQQAGPHHDGDLMAVGHKSGHGLILSLVGDQASGLWW